MSIWVDLTNSYHVFKEGIVGIVRAELEIAQNLAKHSKEVRFFIYRDQSFIELSRDSIDWLLFPKDDFDGQYLKYQKDSLRADKTIWEKLRRSWHRKQIRKARRQFPCFVKSPFSEGDVIFSCGWYGSGKEQAFSKVKNNFKNIKICYLVYDLVLIKHRELFHHSVYTCFAEYLTWISNHCEFVFYGGRTAQYDAEEFFKEFSLKVPKGIPLKFGSRINSKSANLNDTLKKYNISKKFFLCVGSFDAKKNYKVIYRSYKILSMNSGLDLPDLVIVGGNFGEPDLRDLMLRDPDVGPKLRLIRVNDSELNALYHGCLAFLLPSNYEGWSLTLPEALSFNKICLCSDVAPLREVAGNNAIYVPRDEPVKWAQKIEQIIKSPSVNNGPEYRGHTWEDCSKEVFNSLEKIQTNSTQKLHVPTIYYDATLIDFTARSGSPVSGITRTVLLMARELVRIPGLNIKFFSLRKGYREISFSMLEHVLGTGPIDEAVRLDAPNLKSRTISRGNWSMTNNDIVLSLGINFDSSKEFDSKKRAIGFKFVQILYDFTPIKTPQTHRLESVNYFEVFLKHVLNNADYLLFGGRTCQRDYLEFCSEKKLKALPGSPIYFGSNIIQASEDETVSAKYGIDEHNYIIAVGSIEPRKNYELLYDAYVYMLERGFKNIPQLVICGYPGWMTGDFLAKLDRDFRVSKLIRRITPSDSELRTIYARAKFAVLASIYEGWSLTLPEALGEGKFCIASDVEPLKEIGRDLIDYVNPYDPVQWASSIAYYSNNADELNRRVERIKSEWKVISWSECAQQINEIIQSNIRERK